MKHEHIDPNIDRIVGMLHRAKSALDETCRVAKEYAEVDSDLARNRLYLAYEVNLIINKDENANEEEANRYRNICEKLEAQHILLAGELAVRGKCLEDDLSYAVRVSDHFNGKKYPLGMSPL